MRLIDAYTVNMQLVELYNQENNFAVKNALRNAMQVIANAPTIDPPPNSPLTIEELREMDGGPVWIVFLPDTDGECSTMWALVSIDKEYNEIFLMNSICGSSSYEEVWADIKAIYRRKPEECATDG